MTINTQYNDYTTLDRENKFQKEKLKPGARGENLEKVAQEGSEEVPFEQRPE